VSFSTVVIKSTNQFTHLGSKIWQKAQLRESENETKMRVCDMM